MRIGIKKYVVAASGLLIAGVLLALMAGSRSRRSRPSASPELLSVGPSEVTVAWKSGSAYRGRVLYLPAGSSASPQSAAETLGPSEWHEVVIRGLDPSTRYTYWIEGAEERYQFQTQPVATTSFSFLVAWGDVSGRVMSLMMSEFPDFVVFLEPGAAAEKDPLEHARPYVPIFGPSGPRSSLALEDRNGAAPSAAESWKLDWGGLRLVFYRGRSEADGLFDAPSAHTIGVVASPEDVPIFTTAGAPDAEAVRGSALHAILAEHNRRLPSRPAAFVIVPGKSGGFLEVDGVRYLGLRARQGAVGLSPSGTDPLPQPSGQTAGAIRIDVTVESCRAYFVDEGREVALREPPLKERRTCEECRRLADQGAYEESVKAYEEFIRTHEGHFQIDDAYFAIAEILDEKLFEFREALEWYRKLLGSHPDSSLAPLARQRVGFLTAHADHGFEPLARFERVRRIELARQIGPARHESREGHRREQVEGALGEVRAVLEEFPGCSLASTMRYWLANQYRQIDADRAVAEYRAFLEAFPNHRHAPDVWLEIGETYYDARRYGEAAAAYEQAISAAPSRAEAARVQMARAERNLRRRVFAAAGWAVIVLILGLGVLWPPVGVRSHTLVPAGIAFCALSFVVLAAGWLIHEQFSSAGEMVWLAILFSLSATVGPPFTSSFAEKVLRATGPGRPDDVVDPTGTQRSRRRQPASRRLIVAGLGAAMGVAFFLAGAFVATYHVNEHYLIVVGM